MIAGNKCTRFWLVSVNRFVLFLFFLSENQNLGIFFKISNTGYHMLNNKCTEGEY